MQLRINGGFGRRFSFGQVGRNFARIHKQPIP